MPEMTHMHVYYKHLMWPCSVFKNAQSNKLAIRPHTSRISILLIPLVCLSAFFRQSNSNKPSYHG